jgi:hypothetical protein
MLLSDTFTDADGTALSAHTPDSGPGYSLVIFNDPIIVGNKVRAGSGFNFNAVADVGVADVDITATIHSGTWEPNSYIGFTIRATSTNDLWWVFWEANSANISLYEGNGGVYTLRASSALATTNDESHTVRVVASGATITVFLDGSQIISYGSATHNQTATKHGVAISQPTGGQTHYIDDMAIAAAGGGIIPAVVHHRHMQRAA